MKTTRLLIALLLTACCTFVVHAQEDEAEVPPAPAPVPAPVNPPSSAPRPVPPATVRTGSGDNVGVIDFQGVPVQTVLDYYARLTNRSVIAAPNLAGAIYFRSQTNLTRDEMIHALDSVLALNGIAVLPLGEKFLKVVQIATAKQEGISVGVLETGAAPTADALITRIIPMKFVDVADVLGAIQPYIHAYGQLIALTKSNSILITDTGGNINQILEIIKYVDQPSPLRMQTKIYIMQHAKAADVVARLQAIIQETQQLGVRPGSAAPTVPTPGAPGAFRPPVRAGGNSPDETVVEGKVVMTADERTNKIIVLSRESNFPFFDRMVAELDAKVDPDVNIRVFELNYANSEEIASLITSLVTGTSPTATASRRTSTGATPGRTVTPPTASPFQTTGSAAAAALEGGGFLQFAQNVRVLPDPRTNSLLVMATKDDMERLIQLIQSIDTSVAQVLIEVVIAEISLDSDLDVGINLLKRVHSEGSVTMFGGTSTGGGASAAGAPIDLTGAALGSTPTGAAISSALTYFATFRNLKLDVALRALSSSGKFKVLSTPIIQTLHNQEASIIVGESRPIVTATLSDVSGAVVSNQLSTALRSNVEYKDIAIELKVIPRINPDGYVTMEIDQKVNDLGGNVIVGGTESPVITKREARSFVTAKDQSTIVLGGLIREDRTVTETKVPFLGDIPLLGQAFKHKGQSKSRTELIVFIRPTVLRTEEQATAEAVRRVRLLKAGEELELEKRFQAETPMAVETNSSSKATEPNTAPVAEMTEQQRHAAKVKSLSEIK